MERYFLIFVFVVGCSTETGPILHLQEDGGTAGEAGAGEAGAAGTAGAAGAAGTWEGTLVGGTSGKPPRAGAGGVGGEGPGDAETQPLDAQKPVADAGELQDGGQGVGPDAGEEEALGLQCELCAVLGQDGGLQYILECEEGYVCAKTAVGAEKAYCLKSTFSAVSSIVIECEEGLVKFPDGPSTFGQVCKPASGTCEAWLQEFGP